MVEKLIDDGLYYLLTDGWDMLMLVSGYCELRLNTGIFDDFGYGRGL